MSSVNKETSDAVGKSALFYNETRRVHSEYPQRDSIHLATDPAPRLTHPTTSSYNAYVPSLETVIYFPGVSPSSLKSLFDPLLSQLDVTSTLGILPSIESHRIEPLLINSPTTKAFTNKYLTNTIQLKDIQPDRIYSSRLAQYYKAKWDGKKVVVAKCIRYSNDGQNKTISPKSPFYPPNILESLLKQHQVPDSQPASTHASHTDPPSSLPDFHPTQLPTESLVLDAFQKDIQELLKSPHCLHHPRLVSILGFLPSSVSWVQEYHSGGSLEDWLLDRSMNGSDVYRIVKDITEGMCYLHYPWLFQNQSPSLMSNYKRLVWRRLSVNVDKMAIARSALILPYHPTQPYSIMNMDLGEPAFLHRHLRSSNVLLWQDHGKLRAKLSDFGFESRFIAGYIYILDLHKLVLKSTFYLRDKASAYAAPELHQSSVFTVKCDSFALGVLLLEMVTQQDPASAKKDYEAILKQPPRMKGQPGKETKESVTHVVSHSEDIVSHTQHPVSQDMSPIDSHHSYLPTWTRYLIDTCLNIQPHRRPDFHFMYHFVTRNKVNDYLVQQAKVYDAWWYKEYHQQRQQSTHSEAIHKMNQLMKKTALHRVLSMSTNSTVLRSCHVQRRHTMGITLLLMVAGLLLVLGFTVILKPASHTNVSQTPPFIPTRMTQQVPYLYAIPMEEQDVILSYLSSQQVNLIRLVIEETPSSFILAYNQDTRSKIKLQPLFDIEPIETGRYNMTIVARIDDTLAWIQRYYPHIKVILSLHNRFSLGCLNASSLSAYEKEFKVTRQVCGTGGDTVFRVSDYSQPRLFYTSQVAQGAYQARIKTLLTHSVQNTTWSQWSQVIYAFDLQYRPLSGIPSDTLLDGWICDQARFVSPFLRNTHIHIASGGGYWLNESMSTRITECPSITVMSVSDPRMAQPNQWSLLFNTGPWNGIVLEFKTYLEGLLLLGSSRNVTLLLDNVVQDKLDHTVPVSASNIHIISACCATWPNLTVPLILPNTTQEYYSYI